jgi:hypothetical protein
MPRRNILSLVVAVLTAACVGCSNQSPIIPTTPQSNGSSSGIGTVIAPAGLQPTTETGFYNLYFVENATYQVVSTMPVGVALTLWAQVTDSQGVLAQKGSVAFQVCMRESTYPAWRPSAECESGEATWAHVGTQKIEDHTCPSRPPYSSGFGIPSEIGNLCIAHNPFASKTTAMTVGYNVRYIGQGSGIANGESGAHDVTWE